MHHPVLRCSNSQQGQPEEGGLLAGSVELAQFLPEMARLVPPWGLHKHLEYQIKITPIPYIFDCKVQACGRVSFPFWYFLLPDSRCTWYLSVCAPQ
jgi:hypothetical protein